MSSSKFLDYEIALLLAKYGKTALLAALAKKLDLAQEQLEVILQTPLHQKSVSRSGKRPSLIALMAQLTEEYPTKAQLLRTLHARFEDRTFLPELRDVKRFLEQHDRPSTSSKSRTESLPRLLTLLAEIDLAELEALCQAPPAKAYSSLGVISDAILRRKKVGT